MIESCLYKNPNGRYLDIRLDRIQLCGYDRCAAALMNVFATWTSWRLSEIQKNGGKRETPWVFLSKRQLRKDLLGVFGEPSIDRGIEVLKGLEILKDRPPEKIGDATWYLFDFEKANTLLKAVVEVQDLPIPRHPNRRKGWEAQRSSLGNNAEGSLGINAEGESDPLGINAEGCLGNNAEGASALMPTNRNLKEEPENRDRIPPPTSESQTPPDPGSPILDLDPYDPNGEPVTVSPARTKWRKKPKAPEDPNSRTNQLRRMREESTAPRAEAPERPAVSLGTQTTSRTPERAVLPVEAEIWNEVVTSGQRVLAWDWELEEGQHLARCRQHPKFTETTWRETCEKVQKILAGGEGLFLKFRWLLKDNNNWWKAWTGAYDDCGQSFKDRKSKKMDWVEELRQRRDAKNAKAVQPGDAGAH